MNLYYRCWIPYAPPEYPRATHIIDVNGSTWSAGGNTVAGVVQFINESFPTYLPITLDAEFAETQTPAGLLNVLRQLRTALPGRKLITSVAPTADREPALAENYAGMIAVAKTYAPYCDGFKVGVYMIAPRFIDRDLQHAQRCLATFAQAFPRKTIWPEVCRKFQGSLNPDGTTDWGFKGGDLSPDQLLRYARAVTARASACVVFDPDPLMAVFAWV